jgi:TonB family protein
VIDARIPVALGASLLLHGAALAMIERMPRGWQVSVPEWSQWGAGALRVRLRAAGSDEAISPAPEARAGQRAARPDPGMRGAAAPSSGIAAGPRYLPAEELDERPLIRSPVEPVFPPHAPVASGRVLLRLLINEAGAVDEAAALRATPPGVFEAAAVEAFASARFTPGRKDGVAVKSALTLELRFGEALPALAQTRQQEVPLFQPPRRARAHRNNHAQEKP